MSLLSLPSPVSRGIRNHTLVKYMFHAPPAISATFALWAAGDWIHPWRGMDTKCRRLSSATEQRQLKLNIGPWGSSMAAFGQLYFRLPWKLLEAVVCKERRKVLHVLQGHTTDLVLWDALFRQQLDIHQALCVVVRAKKSTALEMILLGTPVQGSHGQELKGRVLFAMVSHSTKEHL